ncbi:hypothetical protein FQR65_LT06711 [Abscondita terminalis]|nr:hypothetical protein FQR65_LT06711 [Abscondita terminalis]
MSSTYDRRGFEGEKIVHLDLKGAPFKISYYKKLFPMLSKLGATGLLMEYEDMFPYSGPLLSSIPAFNAYSLKDIYTINASAKKNNLTVIPLIQTFGHMEFILKLKDYKDLREISPYPQVICPTHKNTLGLIMEMIQQIVEAHHDLDILHIGSDEVWYLGECARCKEFLFTNNLSSQQLFLKHVTTVIKEIRRKFPKLRILMWDDHFRAMTPEDLILSKIGTLVEPVVWKYTSNVEESLHSTMWEMYAKVFPRLWVASAFKGATGSKRYLHQPLYHLQNHRSWLNIIDKYQDIIQFDGIFLTGWQRYDHFAVLCELFPVALPTLQICLKLLSGQMLNLKSSELEDVETVLDLPKYDYPGVDVLEAVHKFHNIKNEFEIMLKASKVKGWVDNYNIKREYSSPYYVETGLANLEYIKDELKRLQYEIYQSMASIYDNYTINEWYSTYMDSTKYVLNALKQDITTHNMQLKAIIQDINVCIGPLHELQNLNSLGRSKISAIRKYIDKYGDIAKESKDTELLQEVVSQREQLASSMDAFKKANIKAMLALEKSNREELLAPKDPETVIKQRQKRNKENLVKISSSVTDQLLSISRQLADTTKRSADTLDTLVTSSDNVVGTQEELKVTSGVISQSGKLLAKYGRREFTDKILMFFAFTFFIACVLYIVEKRLF